jgi:hypothetical protein
LDPLVLSALNPDKIIFKPDFESLIIQYRIYITTFRKEFKLHTT